MRKKLNIKRGVACLLSAAMVLTGAGIIPSVGDTVQAASDSLTLPTPLYFFDFENATEGGSDVNATIPSVGGSENGSAKIIGSGKIETTAGGKVFHNATGEAKKRSDYLLLPEDTFAHSQSTRGFSVGFWVNKGQETVTQFAPFFSAYAEKKEANSWPMMVLQSRLLAQVNCAGYSDMVKEQLTANSKNPSANTEDAEWLNDSNWHYYAATFDNEVLTVYVDGVIQNQWDATKIAERTIGGIYTNGSELKYVCLGGNQAWDWADNDSRYLYDDVAVYNTALTEEQVSALSTPHTVTVTNPSATFEHGEILAFDNAKRYTYTKTVSIQTKPAAGYTADIEVTGASGDTIATTAAKGADGVEVISFAMPNENVSITYKEFKGVDKTKLTEALTAADEIYNGGKGNDDGVYIASTWTAFSDAYKAALAVSTGNSATQGEVDEAKKALVDAQAGLRASCKVSLSKKEMYLTVGGATDTLVATVDTKGDDKSVTWTSLNPTIATVDAAGVVSPVAVGTTVITATAVDGSKAECEVVVTSASSSVGTGTGTVIVNTPGVSTEPTEAPEIKNVGATDYSTGWWSAFSKHYRLSGDFNFNIEFENHGSGANPWNNYVMVFTNQNATAESERLDGYAEYAVIRADNWGWAGGDNTALSGSAITYNSDSTDMATIVKDSTVKMNITRKGSDVTITEDVTSLTDASKKYTRTVTFKAGKKDGTDDGTGDIYFTLTVDGSYLVINSSSGDSAGVPSASPSTAPSTSPSTEPTQSPSTEPTQKPSQAPSTQPSVTPSTEPTQTPTEKASLTLSRSKATIYTGNASNKVTVGVSVTGESNVVTWRTSNAKVAKVTAAGENVVISAVGKGSATITATANGISKTVKVTVKNPTITVKNGKKNAAKVSVKRNKTVKLTVTTNPKKAGTSLAKLSNKDKKVVNASLKNGKLSIKGKKKGKVVLSVKSGKAVKKITVTVK